MWISIYCFIMYLLHHNVKMFEKVVFPMENNNKSQAELYREERKARLAKAAEKSSKNLKKGVDFSNGW